jgi:signal transduction histidine kinase
MLASLVIFLAGMIGMGWWIGRQIEAGVIHRTAATTALYVDSFIAPNLQELGSDTPLTPEHRTALSRLLQDTSLGQQIAAFRVWDAHGRALYSTDLTQTGQLLSPQWGLARAWQGEVVARISDLRDEDTPVELEGRGRLLEIYSPVRRRGTDQIIAVAEFYQTVDDLQRGLSAAQRWSWLLVGGATLGMYLLLAGFVQRASDMIERQQVALRAQVAQLTELLTQNERLHERVRRAAARTTALNERFLRRISAELHDGPAQYLSLALLRLDHVIVHDNEGSPGKGEGQQGNADLDVIQNALQQALQEIRAISAGLGLPQLGNFTVVETLTRIVRAHERRTGTTVTLSMGELPEQAPLPVKITLYRLVQEALSNAYRHAGGVGQQIQVSYEAAQLGVTVTDHGPGFDGTQETDGDKHLGLVGMRERVESLGGQFRIESEPGQGTTVIACLPVQAEEVNDE